MKYTLLTLIAFCFFISHTSAQAPSIQWQNTYGGTDGFDQALSVISTLDGGYIVSGSTTSDDGQVTGVSFTNPGTAVSDMWVVKLSASGALQWEKALGSLGLSSIGQSIIQTSDTNYLVAGTYNDYLTNYVYIFKISHVDGSIIWRKSYGSNGSNSAANVIRETNNRGLIVAGYADSSYAAGAGTVSRGSLDYLVMLLDSAGTVQWQKTYGGANNDKANSIQQTRDSGYIVSGSSLSTDGDVTGHHGTATYQGEDYWVVKLSATGAIQWQKSLGGTGQDISTSIQQTTDGGYIVGGYSASTDGDVTGLHTGGTVVTNPDNWLVKLDPTGTMQWEKTYGGTFSEYAYATQQTIDGGYMMGGSTNSVNGDVTPVHGTNNDFDYWLMKTDASGNLQWQKTLGGSNVDDGYSAIQSADGGYMIAGNRSSTDGDLSGDPAGGFWVVKMAAPNGLSEITAADNLRVYPNPAQDMVTVRSDESALVPYTLTDITGRVILSGITKGKQTLIDIRSLCPGAYVLQTGEINKESFKIVKE